MPPFAREALIKNTIIKALTYTGYSLRRADDLTRLADRYGSDKGNVDSAHGYTRIYNRLFEPIRHAEITFLEIGLHRVDSDGRRVANAAEGSTNLSASESPSLEMW